jgi:type I restriction enzyme R subunit
MSPEERARQLIDRLLTAANWVIQDFKAAHIDAARGAAVREFALDAGQGVQIAATYLSTSERAPQEDP